jgi:two-component sensor histidine kinase
MPLGRYPGWARLLPPREAGLGRALIVSGLATVAAVAVRWPLSELLAGLPFVTFFPAVAAAAVLGGTVAGLITILAGSLVAAWLPGSEGLDFWANRTVATTAFVLVGLVTVALIHILHVLHGEVRGREERLRVIVSEMQHRMGNAFAMIQVLVRLSESRAIDVPMFSRTVQERIGAFQRAQRLIQLDNKQDIELRTLCREVLTPFDLQRVTMPETSALVSSDDVTMLGLVLHELATNALKYGALTNGSGRVAIDWRTKQHELHITWREAGGPQVRAPDKAGGGSRLLDAFRGGGHAAEIVYHPDGLVCELILRHRR